MYLPSWIGRGAAAPVAALLMAVGACAFAQREPPARQRVLLLQSYHAGLEWTDDITTGFSAAAREAFPQAELTIEYMDTKRRDPARMFPLLEDLYAHKYAGETWDVLVTADDNALTFALDRRERLFPGVPIVFCGVNDFDATRLERHEEILGVTEDADVEGTFELMLKLHPAAERIAIVCDGTPTGQYNLARTRRAMAHFAGRTEFVEFVNMTVDELRRALQALPSDSLVYRLVFYRDREDRTLTLEESNKLVAGASQLPVYTSWGRDVVYGFLGGVLTEGRRQGEVAAELVDRVLQGELTADLDIVRDSPTIVMFDYRQMIRFGIRPSQLPRGAEIIGRPDTIYTTHRSAVVVAVVAFVLLGLLLALTVASIARRLRAEKALRRSEAIERAFRGRLTALQTVTNRLAVAGSLSELCRLAVSLGRSELGFDRLGIWVSSPDDQTTLNGMFGTDEHGNMTDERNHVLQVREDLLITELFARGGAPIHKRDWPLVNAGNVLVGQGDVAVAALCDEEGIHGFVSMDNLIRRRPISEADRELLNLYASSVGHLVSLRQAQDELRDRAEFHRQLLHNLHAAVVVHGADTRILMSNRKAGELLGIGPDTMSGKAADDPQWDFIRESGEVMPQASYPVNCVLRTGEPETNLVVGVRHHDDGKVVWVLCNAFPVLNDNGRIDQVVVTFTDITDLKHVEEERRGLEVQVRHAQKLDSLGILAGGIAHDFNNLLVGILGNADLALDGLPPGSDARRNLTGIKAAAVRASELATQMLAYSGKGHLVVAPVSLNSVIREMGMLLEASVGKNVQIVWDLDRTLPPVDADATQMRQVIMNLITNASDAIGVAKGTLTVCTRELEADADSLQDSYLGDSVSPGRFVSVSVTDDGCGMDEETRAKLFDPFFTTKLAGRGLGLAAVLGIVRGHKGTVRVQSQPRCGTTVTILIPPSSEPLRQPAAEPMVAEHAPELEGTGAVLVIDDERSLRVVATDVLSRHGFEPLVAENGASGIRLFRERADDIVAVFLDLTMPDMSGEVVFEELSRVRADVPVILCSGFSRTEATALFPRGKLADFLEKPFSLNAFVAVLAKVLGGATDEQCRSAAD